MDTAMYIEENLFRYSCINPNSPWKEGSLR